ncbi:hypothetical protein AVEN_184329-1 [Araneus ventricosus]|uniref:Uncharacterized protein n=1 Tax=Araneus ventricosus TaxID=182803 RepID=A0A4Y2TXW4_ARAVE|nr:hypothetical protein AVEN_180064-1 [Araneus ventricosus]GBO04166.1 hypothetical protein AVEN_184329-1 [Araneus ventricosus]
MLILRDTGTTVDIVSRNRIRPEMLTDYVLQTRAQKREAEQNKETGQLRNTFSKEINTKEVGKFRSSKVLASYVLTPRNSDMTAKTNETVNQSKTINKRKKFQSSKFPEVQSPALSTCASVNDTKIKSVTKISKRPNKYSFFCKCDWRSHFLHSEVISEEKGNETLDTILQVKCQESGNKAFSIKTISDMNQEIIKDAEFGSEPEKERQTSFRENKLTEEDELISDCEIPVSANRLNDSAQKKSNIDSTETEISYKSHLSSVNTENDEYLIEMRIEKEDMAELMQLKKEDLLFDVKTVPYALVSDAEDTRRKSLNSQTAENLANENIVRKYEAMDTSETISNENGATRDEPNVEIENFNLSHELHGPASLPNYGESSHSTPTKCKSMKKAKYIVKRQHKSHRHRKKKEKRY